MTNFSVGIIAQVVTILSSMLFIPIFIKEMGEGNYYFISVFNVVASYLMITDLALSQLTLSRKRLELVQTMFTNSLIFHFFVSSVLGATLLSCVYLSIVFKELTDYKSTVTILLTIPILFLMRVTITFCRNFLFSAQKHDKAYLIQGVFAIIRGLFLCLYVIYHSSPSYGPFMYLLIMLTIIEMMCLLKLDPPQVFSSNFILAGVRNYRKFCNQNSAIIQNVVIGSFLWLGNSGIDKMYAAYVFNDVEFVVYSTAVLFQSVAMMLNGVFGQINIPFYAKSNKSEVLKRFYTMSAASVAVIFIYYSIGYIFVEWFLILWSGPDSLFLQHTDTFYYMLLIGLFSIIGANYYHVFVSRNDIKYHTFYTFATSIVVVLYFAFAYLSDFSMFRMIYNYTLVTIFGTLGYVVLAHRKMLTVI